MLGAALGAAALAQADSNPFVGRWDFDIKTSSGVGANWLGITDKGGKLEVWFQPTGGHVHPVEDVKQDGSHLTLVVSPASSGHSAMTWDLDASGDTLKGVQKNGDKTMDLSGVRAPELNDAAVTEWDRSQAAF